MRSLTSRCGRAPWLIAACLAGSLLACETRRERELVTRVEALAPAPPRDDEPEPTDGPCLGVERQARELGAALPRRLDADTLATRVSAKGCHLTMEYELVTLSAGDVAARGVDAMRARVVEQLCEDRGALGVLHRGGSFTNVYYDEARTQIGQFTVAADDCDL